MRTDRPLIGVPWPKPDYIAALEKAGAEVRILEPGPDRVSSALEQCDGVLLTGGDDVDPREYGEGTRHETVDVDPARDEYELAIARSALDRDLPLFAICRGAQVLNVAAGGTLIQDIPSQRPSEVTHSITEPKAVTAHEVTIRPASCLAVLLSSRLNARHQVHVNSRHHQSVRVVAPGFVVSATAPDGIVEAIERPGSRFCLGVQWHPENFWRTGEFASLFAGFVAEAQKYRDDRRSVRR